MFALGSLHDQEVRAYCVLWSHYKAVVHVTILCYMSNRSGLWCSQLDATRRLPYVTEYQHWQILAHLVLFVQCIYVSLCNFSLSLSSSSNFGDLGSMVESMLFLKPQHFIQLHLAMGQQYRNKDGSNCRYESQLKKNIFSCYTTKQTMCVVGWCKWDMEL